MKEEDIVKDILEKYPNKEILSLCSDTISRGVANSLKALGAGKPEVCAGCLGEITLYVNLLKKLSDKENNSEKETVIVA